MCERKSSNSQNVQVNVQGNKRGGMKAKKIAQPSVQEKTAAKKEEANKKTGGKQKGKGKKGAKKEEVEEEPEEIQEIKEEKEIEEENVWEDKKKGAKNKKGKKTEKTFEDGTAKREVDEKCMETFLNATILTINDGDLPMEGKQFWTKFIVPCKEKGSALDIKLSTYGNLNKFFIFLNK